MKQNGASSVNLNLDVACGIPLDAEDLRFPLALVLSG